MKVKISVWIKGITKRVVIELSRADTYRARLELS